ncbi:MAG UNVERIFIED_CONTAM: hypothetical protein LVT10_24000 [Anaerolineae bacterium]|jgi:hypothetical protein
MPTLSPRWQRYWIMTRFALIALASLGLYGIVVRPVLFKQSVAPYLHQPSGRTLTWARGFG